MERKKQEVESGGQLMAAEESSGLIAPLPTFIKPEEPTAPSLTSV
jgi:hypothetical protein